MTAHVAFVRVAESVTSAVNIVDDEVKKQTLAVAAVVGGDFFLLPDGGVISNDAVFDVKHGRCRWWLCFIRHFVSFLWCADVRRLAEAVSIGHWYLLYKKRRQ